MSFEPYKPPTVDEVAPPPTYATSGRHETYSDPRVLGFAALGLFGLGLTLAWALNITDLSALDDLLAGNIPPGLLQTEDALVKGSQGARIVGVIFFLAWMHRVTRNAHALGGPIQYSPGAAVGWWFVPFANLVMPFRIVSEVWVASDPEGRPVASPMVLLWWVLFIAQGLAAYAPKAMNAAHDVRGIVHTNVMVTSVTTAAFAALAFVVVTIMRGQQRRVAAGALAPVE